MTQHRRWTLNARAAGESGAATRAARRLNAWDLAGMAGGLLLCWAVTCVLSRGRVFWEDEMLGWMLLRDPSWRHMVWAWRMGADGGGFLFYLTGRGWLHLFGPSELAFRLYSSTCFGLALAAIWAAARRFYTTGVVFFAVFNTWFFSPPIIFHLREGRFYGLLTLGVCLAVWIALVLGEDAKSTPWRFYVALFLAHATLTTSHLLGVVYSAALLGAVVVLDLIERRWRPLLYLSGAASWLLLWTERANITASTRVGKPHFWTKPPGLLQISQVYTGSSHEIALVLCVLVVAVVCVLWRGGAKGDALRWAYIQRRPVYIVTAALLLVPVGFLIEGLLGTWLFTPERYLMPIAVALVFITAEAIQILRAEASEIAPALVTRVASALRQQPVLRPAIAVMAFAVFFAALLFWDLHHLREDTMSPLDYTAGLTAKLPVGIPVVCEDAFTFTELLGRQHASGVRFLYLLDWQHSISRSAPPVEVTQYHLMENWRKVGYFSGSIEPIEQFLSQNSRFLIVHSGLVMPSVPPDIGNPLAARLAPNPAYEVEPYTDFDHGILRDTVWLVCRGRCSAYGPLPPPSGRY